ncbi:MAG: phage/plasmid primase, P4 family [Rhodomicrobium sp.]
MGFDMDDLGRAGGDEAVRRAMDGAIPFGANGTEETDREPAFSDEAIALKFAAAHANELRYIAAWNKWAAYQNGVWRLDDTKLAFNMVRKLCRQSALECNRTKEAKALASRKTVAAVVALAEADRRIAATVSQWDADPWLLNTPAGVYDLRTGKNRPHRPEDYMIQITNVAPDASCGISTWRGFLNRITAGDAELEAYLQRVAGYCLTGETSEHALFFGHGAGANGKTTFLEAIRDCLGAYHKSAPVEMFTETKSERHPTEVARLQGARLVTATETEEGRQWAEAKIKALTGGEMLPARFMRQDYFEFMPAFKLIITGNHMPSLRSVDEAIRRRMHLIPFAVTIPKGERDLELGNKLKRELPGIMAWMMEGCEAWRQRGLAPPPAVTRATAEYLSTEDTLAAWLAECTEKDVAAWTPTSNLFASWKAYAERTGEAPGSQKALTQKLKGRDFHFQRKTQGTGFNGIRLKSSSRSFSRAA